MEDDDVLAARLRLDPASVEGLICHGVPTDSRISRAHGHDTLDLWHLFWQCLDRIQSPLRIPWPDLHTQLGPGVRSRPVRKPWIGTAVRTARFLQPGLPLHAGSGDSILEPREPFPNRRR